MYDGSKGEPWCYQEEDLSERVRDKETMQITGGRTVQWCKDPEVAPSKQTLIEDDKRFITKQDQHYCCPLSMQCVSLQKGFTATIAWFSHTLMKLAASFYQCEDWGWQQGVTNLILPTFWAGRFFTVRSSPVHGRVFTSILDAPGLNASSILCPFSSHHKHTSPDIVTGFQEGVKVTKPCLVENHWFREMKWLARGLILGWAGKVRFWPAFQCLREPMYSTAIFLLLGLRLPECSQHRAFALAIPSAWKALSSCIHQAYFFIYYRFVLIYLDLL